MISHLLRGALASLSLLFAPLSVPGDASAATRADGLTLVSSTPIDARMTELTFRTPALADLVKVRVLVPREAAGNPGARYPALYLLHGSGADAAAWTQLDAEQLTEGMGLVVVMPDGGHDGWYTDWPSGAQPQWERFHVDQLIPWIDAHEPVIAARGKRAIAGFSMGGFGAMSYAARHPDLFVAASSFSGALDLGVPAGSAPSLVGVQPWGPWTGPALAWRGHNPADLAANLRGVYLSIYTGEGDGGDDVEPVIHQQSASFAAKTGALGIARQYVDYGVGGHDGELFKRDLMQALPGLMGVLDHPPDPPSSWSFTATEQSFGTRGYTVRAARDALAWRTLSRVRSSGFTVTTDSATVVTTARRYVRRARYRVVVTPRAGARATTIVRSSSAGALTIRVPGSAAVGITRAAAAS